MYTYIYIYIYAFAFVDTRLRIETSSDRLPRLVNATLGTSPYDTCPCIYIYI